MIRSAGNCSRRPLVQVTCRHRLDGVASNPLESILSQVTNKHSTPWSSYDHGVVLETCVGILCNGLLATPSNLPRQMTCTNGLRLQFAVLLIMGVNGTRNIYSNFEVK
jgi:hypothetical protein